QGTPLTFAGVWLMDPDGGTLFRESWHGRVVLRPVREGTVDLGRSVIGQVMLGCRPIQVEGERVAPELLMNWGDCPEYMKAFLGIPLIRSETRFGVLCLLSSRWLSEEEVTLLSLLARHVAFEADAMGLELNPSLEDGLSQTEPERGILTTFTTRVTHELRSPLTSLRGNVQLAARAVQKGDPDRAEKRLRAALVSADAMARLLENLQDMCLLERGELTLAPVPADLTEIVSSVVRRVADEVNDRHHVLKFVAPEHLLGIFDTRRVGQCLFNLIANAVKYSPAGRVIRVQVEREADHARVSIIDEGAGISEEEQDRIFEPYYRGAVIDTVDARGLGLGLPISLAIAEGHGGRIDVRSELGRGSTFIVRLPLVPPGAAGP
ncbi:MAG TPA: GAF domain-containing sensor histidine kinase, partial [Nitrolancea sp.]|nr:GAF domain-containing sensor histidine kinase [Nitrolancea sp.]